METASEQAPAATEILDSGADVRVTRHLHLVEPGRRSVTMAARDHGERLREARTARGLSQNALAKASGVNHATVCQLEGIIGRTTSTRSAAAIAAALDREPADLFTTDIPLERVGERSRPACAPQDRQDAEASRATSAALWAAARQEQAELGLLDSDEVKKMCGFATSSMVTYYVRKGLLRAERDSTFNRLYLFERTEVERFQREDLAPLRQPKYEPARPRTCAREDCTIIEFTPRPYAPGLFCSTQCKNEAQRIHPAPGTRVCDRKGCNARFEPLARDAAKGYGNYCSRDCYHAVWAPLRRRTCIGRFKLAAVQEKGRHAKGKAQAIDVGQRALVILAGLNGKWSPELRRSVLESLMREFEGDHSVFLSDGTRRSRRDDGEYRKARARVHRRLKRACTLLPDAQPLERLL